MKPGIFSDLPMDAYIAERAFSSGLAHTLLSRSPLHAWVDSPWNPAREQDQSGTADIGTYAHALLLEGEAESLVICPFDDWRKADARAMRDDAYKMGKLPILEAKVDEIKAMVEAAKTFIASTEIADIWEYGEPEATVIWQQGELLCKARPDWLTNNRDICLSYKTTKGSAHPDAWIRTQLPLYDIGIVMYEEGIRIAAGVEKTRVITLVQEQSAPYSCSLIGLDPAWQEMAENKLTLAQAAWQACIKANIFPAYPTRICWASPKAWQMAEQQERELQDAENAIGKEYDISTIWSKPE